MRSRFLVALTILSIALVAAAAASAGQPLATALIEPTAWGGITATDLDVAYTRARAAGISAVRTDISWESVAPKTLPASWQPTNPDDPRYDWTGPDAKIKAVAAKGLVPIVAINGTPGWASLVDSPVAAPKAADYGAFATAAARRYSGRTRGLPHVKYWQAWVEPNLSIFFVPQFEGTKPVSPAIYRSMVNAFAASVHAASPQNRVIAGGTAPFRDISPEIMKIDQDWGPLSFMRQVLCLSRDLRPTCRARVHFDIWAHHPYTSGGPSHKAAFADDVSLGDLRKITTALRAGTRARHIVSKGPVRFWVTEFSWDSSPPDPKGVPMALLTRWVAEALYTMWRNGVSLVTWLQLRDDPPEASFLQSGLYYRGKSLASDQPKPLLRAFRFPFVAYPTARGVEVWGRSPTSKRGAVAIEARVNARWRAIGRLTADANGIFRGEVTVRGNADLVRARYRPLDAVAAAFSLKAPADQFFNPFGQPTLLEPNRKQR